MYDLLKSPGPVQSRPLLTVPGDPFQHRVTDSVPSYLTRLLNTNPIILYPLSETDGTAAEDVVGGFDGTYTDVALDTGAFLDGTPYATWNGTIGEGGSHVPCYSADLVAALDEAEGGMAAWLRVANVGVWTDAQTRYLYNWEGSAATTQIRINTLGSGGLRFIYVTGGTAKNFTQATDTTDWFHVAMTWSQVNDERKIYFNGDVVDTATALGTPGAYTPTTSRFDIGAFSTTPAGNWSGNIKYLTFWGGTVPSDADIAAAAIA